MLHFPNSRILWINTYFPTDPQLQDYDDSELQELLQLIKHIINTEHFDDILWGSDINWDPARKTKFSRTLKGFIQEMGLSLLWDSIPVP